MHLRLCSDFSHKHFVTYSQSVGVPACGTPASAPRPRTLAKDDEADLQTGGEPLLDLLGGAVHVHRNFVGPHIEEYSPSVSQARAPTRRKVPAARGPGLMREGS